MSQSRINPVSSFHQSVPFGTYNLKKVSIPYQSGLKFPQETKVNPFGFGKGVSIPYQSGLKFPPAIDKKSYFLWLKSLNPVSIRSQVST